MDMSRREFLHCIPAGALVSAWPLGAAAAAGPRIGCQTNAWAFLPGDFAKFLEVLGAQKSLGFEGFETSFRNVQGQYADAPAARVRLEQTGLAFFGVHIFLNEYDPQTRIAPMDLVRATADGGAALGAQRLIVSGAGLVKDGKVAREDVDRKVAGLQEAARYCRDRKLAFAYHNHGPEFAAGAAELTALIERTDPALVSFLIDCGWAYRAGVDLAGFFTAHQTRIAGLHLRDFKGEQQVPLGLGEVDWAPLASAVRKAGWDGWVLAEEERADGSKPGATAAAPARDTLRKLFGR
ncbi:MAG: sugar phosphate isomerase/epimerase [Acidobacteria bacterium]|nr:sugar phosphate isomerase/epimerase [Acidobacteriota bacterium]